MELSASREFSYPMDVAWQALQHTSKLDIEPGSEVEVISDSEWNAYLHGHEDKNAACTHYATSFDAAAKQAVIEGKSNKKHVSDFITLTLEETASGVNLTADIQINAGMNLIARALAPVVKTQARDIIMKQIFGNFEALCAGEETTALTVEDLNAHVKAAFEPKE